MTLKIKLEPTVELNKIEVNDKYNDFDWEVYIHFNPDLPIDTNLSNAKSLARKHFIENGQYENRIYKFDWIKYINENNLSLHIKNKQEMLDYISQNKLHKKENIGFNGIVFNSGFQIDGSYIYPFNYWDWALAPKG